MTISERKLRANKANGLKGGEATRLKFKREYEANPKICPQCNEALPQKKRHNTFCSQSCSASFNNKGVRRHGKAPGVCKVCGKPKSGHKSKYCSIACGAEDRKLHRTPEELRARNAENQARYRARYGNVRAYAEGADPELIREFYAKRPEGYEVDHIIPLSKGGLHHQDNLQYLTPEDNKRKSNKLPR